MAEMKFVGTPEQIGGHVFERMCLPVLREAHAKMQATPIQMARLYSGFIGSCLGAMAADFSQEGAVAMAQTILDAFESASLGEGTQTQ